MHNGYSHRKMKKTPTSSIIGQRMEQWRTLLGYTRAQVVENMKTIDTETSLYRLETGRTQSVSNDVLEDYAQAINLTVDKLLTNPVKVVKIKIRGEVKNGGSVVLYQKEEAACEVEAPASANINENDIIAIRVTDRSMEPRLYEGDVVFYSERTAGVEDGVIGARLAMVMLKTGEMMVRRVTNGSKSGLFHLTSLDSAVDPVMDAELLWAAKVLSITPA